MGSTGVGLIAWSLAYPGINAIDHLSLPRIPTRTESWSHRKRDTAAALNHCDGRVAQQDRSDSLSSGGTWGFDWVWQFGLYKVDEKRTRFVSRSRVGTQTVWARLLTYAIEPAGFLMNRRMLIGIKERAEALRAGRADSHGDRYAA